MKYQTTGEAAQYIYEIIKKTDPESEIIDQKNIQEIIQEEILDKLELDMEESDIKILEDNKGDVNFFDTYLSKKYDEYQSILTDIVNDMVSEYILDESKE